MCRTFGCADGKGLCQLPTNLDTEFGESEWLSSHCPGDERAAGIRAYPLHLAREDAERHAELGRGSRHRVMAGDDQEPFGTLRRILPDEDPAKKG